MANRSFGNKSFERRRLLGTGTETDEENDSKEDGPALPVSMDRAFSRDSPNESEEDEASPAEAELKEEDRELVTAVEASDERAVKTCLSMKQADPNVSFSVKKIRCLHLATMNGDLNIVKLLVKGGADINATDSKGVTPLHVAAGMGLPEVIKFLANSGANLNATDWAIIKGEKLRENSPVREDVVVQSIKLTDKIVLENENQSNGISNQMKENAIASEPENKTPSKKGFVRSETPLHRATRKGQSTSVRKLLKLGAEVESLDGQGKTPLHLAAELGHVDIMKQLLARKANPNVKDKTGDSPLHRAIRNAQSGAVEILLSNGAEVETLDWQGRTPLHVAADLGDVDIIRLLLEREADSNARDTNDDGPLFLLVKFMARKKTDTKPYKEGLDLLIKAKAQFNYVCSSSTGASLLHQAVILGQLDATELLLSVGASLDAQDNEKNTVIHSCCIKGHSDVLRALVNDKRITKEMINAPDSKKWTPLHAAAYRGFTECIHILLEAGADLGLKTQSGVSAMTMILQLPQGPKILGDVFGERIETNGIDPSDPNCELAFNYSVLISKHKKQQMCVIEDILDIPNEQRTADLFQHPLIASFLFLKWKRIRMLFFFMVIVYVLLVVGITAVVLTTLAYDTPLNGTSEQISGSSLNSSEQNPNEEHPILYFQMSLIFVIVIIILLELVQFVSMPAQYFQETESYVKLGTIITSSILVFQPIPWIEWIHSVAAWAVLFGWAEVTFLIGRLPYFGVYALMFYSVAEHLGKLIMVFCFFLFGFSLSFHIIFLQHESNAYKTPWSSVLRTLGMMTGDFGYDDYLTDGKNSIPVTANLIYFVFLMLISLVLMNLLIGLAVSDTQGLQKEGTVTRLRKQAQFIIYLEDVINNRLFNTLLCRCLGDKMSSWINQDTDITIYPSVRKQSVRLPSAVVEEALAIAKARMEPTVESTLNESYDLLLECASAVRNLDQRIDSIQQDLTKLKKKFLGESSGTAALTSKLGLKRLFGGKSSRETTSQETEDRSFSEDTSGNLAQQRRLDWAKRSARSSKMFSSTTTSADSDLQEIKSILLQMKASLNLK